MTTSRLLVPALCALTLAGAACRAEQAITEQTITVRMPSAAMERTLDESEEVVVALRARDGGDPVEAGDIVLFGFPSDTRKRLILRVAGLPGDTLEMRDGTLHRNGRRVRERYARHRDQGVDPAGEEFRWQRNYAPRRHRARRGGAHRLAHRHVTRDACPLFPSCHPAGASPQARRVSGSASLPRCHPLFRGSTAEGRERGSGW